MKYICTWLIVLAVCAASFAQATASTNQTISVGAIASLQLDLRSDHVEIKPTKGSRVIIESHVTLENVNNSNMLDYLIKVGRYELVTNLDASNNSLTVERKANTHAVLVVKGQECIEKVRYVVLVPDSIKTIKQHGTTTPME